MLLYLKKHPLLATGAGLAGGLAGGSTADTVAGAQAGKNAVENNALGEIIGQQVSGVSEAEKYQNAQKQIKASMTKFLCHDNISSAKEDRFLKWAEYNF
nr:VENN motif pre-toxin domain-containing protein [Yersinia massiliensis]